VKLRYEIDSHATDVKRDQWRLAATAFSRCGMANVTPKQAATVLGIGYSARQCIDTLAAMSVNQLSRIVCTLLAERRVRRNRRKA